jgi:DNA-binding GntR family transcriptional regulator
MDAPAAIALVRSTSLSTLVEGEVLRMILTGELDAGQQIKEIAIAERLGVGRSSLREAMRALEAAGLVRIEKNGTLTFARWSAEDCELLATTPVGLVIAAAHCKPQCLDWFLAAAAAHIRKD